MISENSSLIKIISENFLKAMGEEGSVELEKLPEEQGFLVKLNLFDPQFLIGPRGVYLEAFERILRAMVRKKTEGEVFLSVDINNYRKRRADFLRDLAREIGDQVSLSKKQVTLEPMSAFERRVIHSEIASREDLASESIGEDPERRVVIKPRIEL